ncbi:MAG: DUF885 domain-containing protein, partial [Fuerstiella sp.]|nr:DUF885 domain-containing protein [Fuerstiella sp.]
MKVFFTVTAMLTSSLVAMATLAAEPEWIAASDKNAMYVLEQQAPFTPENMSSSGLSQFDTEVLDLRRNVFERSRDNDQATFEELQRRLKKERHPKVRQDLEILSEAVQRDIVTADIERANLLPS